MQNAFILRAIISTKDAGVVIGKAGRNVTMLLERAAVKANVSNVIPGVNDRVVTVSGALEQVAMAYAFIAQTLLDNVRLSAASANQLSANDPPAPGAPSTLEPDVAAVGNPPASSNGNMLASGENDTVSLRLLISHFLMGSIIGRSGAKIKTIQETAGCHMTATKDMLPESTERVVEVRGTPESIRIAVFEIGKCLLIDWDRGVGTILYNPAVRLNPHASSLPNQHLQQHQHQQHHSPYQPQFQAPYPNVAQMAPQYRGSGGYSPRGPAMASGGSPSPEDIPGYSTDQIAIPADMVGCLIGRGGGRIAEIRRASGARISIAKNTNEETGRRLFTISGPREANERAISMLYGQLDAERDRRLAEGGAQGISRSNLAGDDMRMGQNGQF